MIEKGNRYQKYVVLLHFDIFLKYISKPLKITVRSISINVGSCCASLQGCMFETEMTRGAVATAVLSAKKTKQKQTNKEK